MIGSEFIIDLLYRNGVKTVFTVPGAHVGSFLNELVVQQKVRPVICAHEAGAAFMADGYSRINRVPGVVITNGGPGLSNLITGIVVAKSEYIPLVVISGDVPVNFSNYEGFQEAGVSGSNDLDITRNLVKYSNRVDHIAELHGYLTNAFTIAQVPPMGPVHLIIPYNIFEELIPDQIPSGFNNPGTFKSKSFDVKEIESLLASSKRILLYAGESLNGSRCEESLLSIVDNYHVPVVTTYGAKGIISENHNLNFGNAGYAGRSKANQLLLSDEIDGIIFLGVKLNERNTLNWNPDLLAASRICIHIDYETSNNIFADFKHITRKIFSPGYAINQIADKILPLPQELLAERMHWIAEVSKNLIDYPLPAHNDDGDGLEPGLIISELRHLLPVNTALFVDSGQHRLFPGYYWTVPVQGRFFTSSIGASTGWAIGSALGAKIENPHIPVVTITGDSCMRMHGFEVQTAVKEKLPVIFYIFNNRSMGSVYQRMIKKGLKPSGLVDNYGNDWKKFAESVQAFGCRVRSLEELIDQTRLALERQNCPSILDVSIKFPSYIPDNQYTRSAYA